MCSSVRGAQAEQIAKTRKNSGRCRLTGSVNRRVRRRRWFEESCRGVITNSQSQWPSLGAVPALDSCSCRRSSFWLITALSLVRTDKQVRAALESVTASVGRRLIVFWPEGARERAAIFAGNSSVPCMRLNATTACLIQRSSQVNVECRRAVGKRNARVQIAFRLCCACVFVQCAHANSDCDGTWAHTQTSTLASSSCERPCEILSDGWDNTWFSSTVVR